MSEVKTCPKCQCNSLEQRRDKSWWCLYASCGYDEPYIDELQALRDERDRLRAALEQVSFHLAQPGDDETPANQYVPTAVEILACQSIIEAALTPGEGGQDE